MNSETIRVTLEILELATRVAMTLGSLYIAHHMLWLLSNGPRIARFCTTKKNGHQHALGILAALENRMPALAFGMQGCIIAAIWLGHLNSTSVFNDLSAWMSMTMLVGWTTIQVTSPALQFFAHEEHLIETRDKILKDAISGKPILQYHYGPATREAVLSLIDDGLLDQDGAASQAALQLKQLSHLRSLAQNYESPAR